MTLEIHRSADRGGFDHGWLNARHSFSFGGYHDPARMGFRSLRVMNEDRVQPGTGFDWHGHRDMEIVTYVLSGELEHKDSTGGGGILRHGDVQHMSAGSGVMHSERNPSTTEELHLLQIWIVPSEAGLQPSYEDRRFEAESLSDRLAPIAAGDGRDGALRIRADVVVHAGLLSQGARVTHELAAGRHTYIQVARGGIRVDGLELAAGDAVSGGAGSAAKSLEIEALESSELLLFDLA